MRVVGRQLAAAPKALSVNFTSLGPKKVKNIEEPVLVYSVSVEAPSTSNARASLSYDAAKATIAVMPFSNLSNDEEQRHFIDGITEDIISGLSRFHSLVVIARNSTFRLRDAALTT